MSAGRVFHTPGFSYPHLCQGCLRVRFLPKYTVDASCECGDELCGCSDCLASLAALEAGHRSAARLGLKADITSWNALEGATGGLDG